MKKKGWKRKKDLKKRKILNLHGQPDSVKQTQKCGSSHSQKQILETKFLCLYLDWIITSPSHNKTLGGGFQYKLEFSIWIDFYFWTDQD